MEKALYLIILIEGYVILATELLAIRQTIPFIGSGIETVAIIVSAVLMPLAIGYYFGGKYRPKIKCGQLLTVRKKLISNVIVSAVVLSLGLSHATLEAFFSILNFIGIQRPILQTAVYSLLFVVYPIFLLGQTVPLISNYFSRKKLSEIAGRMLFFSTIGSFLGSVISTLILMSLVGVNNTVIITISLMVLLIFILNSKRSPINYAMVMIPLSFALLLNNSAAMQKLGIVENNNYSTIKILGDASSKNGQIFSINNSLSSQYSEHQDSRFFYLKYIEKVLILSESKPKKSVLVVGAGGFTLGVYDDYNEYTFLDIDKSLKKVSEKFFLKKSLGKNKVFFAESPRSFLRRTKEKYDVILVDAYTNTNSIPSDLITKEFFTQIKDSLKDGGVVTFNMIVSSNFSDKYTAKIDNTMRAVFDHFNRHVFGEYDGFQQPNINNVLYIYFNKKYGSEIYTDNRNSYFLDKK